MQTVQTEYKAVCEVEELPDAQPLRVSGGVCVVRTGDSVRAFVDRCPHRGHPLSEGACDGGVLTCALHGWQFRLDDGAAVAPAAPFGLEMREARVRGGIVEVELAT